jgi:hypothetical protein
MTRQDALGQVCNDFLRRIVRDKIQAFTSAIVVAEVTHRVMVAEAIQQTGIGPRDIVTHLKKHPKLISSLTRHLNVASEIYRMGISIEPVTRVELHRSKAIRRQYGLMTNDSLVVACMQGLKLTDLATNDSDFGRVDIIRVWKPLVHAEPDLPPA